MSGSDLLSDDVKAQVNALLHELIGAGSGIYAALFSSIDGYAVTDARRVDLPESKFAAMTSSLIALGESVAREGQQTQCQYVVIVNSDGVVATKRCSKHFVLTVLARKDTNLGMVLSSARGTIDKINTIIKD